MVRERGGGGAKTFRPAHDDRGKPEAESITDGSRARRWWGKDVPASPTTIAESRGRSVLRMVHERGIGGAEAVDGGGHDPAREARALAAEIQPVHARFVRRAVTVEPNRT